MTFPFPAVPPSGGPPYDAGTWAQSQTTARGFGDNDAERKNLGMRFTTVEGGGVTSVKINCTGATSGGGLDATAYVYTDNAGSPGTQVGASSDEIPITSSGDKTFTFASPPSVAAATNYWLVVSDTEGTNGSANIGVWADTGNTNPSGIDDTITQISDHSNSIPPANEGWRMEVIVTP